MVNAVALRLSRQSFSLLPLLDPVIASRFELDDSRLEDFLVSDKLLHLIIAVFACEFFEDR